MSARVVKPGMLTTVQDLGRIGAARSGLAPGGAMDHKSYLWANRLLENPPGAPVLEIAYGALSLRFRSDTTVSVTGAQAPIRLSGRGKESGRSFAVCAGELLEIGRPSSGIFTYLAFPGGLVSPTFAGSASVVRREQLPPGAAHPLIEGDILTWKGGRPGTGHRIPGRFLDAYPDTLELPFLPAYDWSAFSAQDREQFVGTEWTVSRSSSRVSVQLDGSALKSGPRILDSVPLVDGTIQVLASGRPLVFMRDRPTIGGYPKLGSVVPDAVDRLSQARPGVRIRFLPADADHALEEARRMARFFGSG